MKNPFRRYTKWEIYRENVPMIHSHYTPYALGAELIHESKVMVDIYVKYHLRTGLPKYKNIIKKA